MPSPTDQLDGLLLGLASASPAERNRLLREIDRVMRGRCQGILRSLLSRSHLEAELPDIYQELLCKILGWAERFRPGPHPGWGWAWIRTVAIHLTRNLLRKRRREVLVDDAVAQDPVEQVLPDSDEHPAMRRRRLARLVRETLRKVRPTYRREMRRNLAILRDHAFGTPVGELARHYFGDDNELNRNKVSQYKARALQRLLETRARLSASEDGHG